MGSKPLPLVLDAASEVSALTTAPVCTDAVLMVFWASRDCALEIVLESRGSGITVLKPRQLLFSALPVLSREELSLKPGDLSGYHV